MNAVRYGTPSTKTIQKNVMLKLSIDDAGPANPLTIQSTRSKSATQLPVPGVCETRACVCTDEAWPRDSPIDGTEAKTPTAMNESNSAPAAPQAYIQNGIGSE